MYVQRLAWGVHVQAPAKLNLFFEVFGKRNDGFHEIETLMVPIGLYDSLSFEPQTSGPITVDCRWAAGGDGSPLGELPASQSNIVTRALELLRQRAGINDGARVRLLKRIPLAAGLGGGSSDAAAALVAANIGWKIGWSTSALSELAGALGSDVPFFFAPGAAICRGRGELIEPVAGIGSWHFVLVRPPEGLSTASVYARCQASRDGRSSTALIDAMRRGDARRIAATVHNALEPAAESLSPWIGRLRREFQRLDCVATQMSGSGSSYFGICRNARHARRAAELLKSRGVGRVYAVRS